MSSRPISWPYPPVIAWADQPLRKPLIVKRGGYWFAVVPDDEDGQWIYRVGEWASALKLVGFYRALIRSGRSPHRPRAAGAA